MSYILDALKKSELQRNATRIPTIVAPQGVPVEHAQASRAPLLAAIALLLVLAAGAAWWMLPRVAPSHPAPAPAADAGEPSRAAASQVDADPIAPSPSPPLGRGAAEAMPRLKLAVSLPAARGVPAAAPAEWKAKPAESAAVPAPAAAKGVVAYGDLPAAIRQALPGLVISGFAAGDGGATMVMVDDKLLREGDEAAPGVRVERIFPEGAEFSYKGYRFRR